MLSRYDQHDLIVAFFVHFNFGKRYQWFDFLNKIFLKFGNIFLLQKTKKFRIVESLIITK